MSLREFARHGAPDRSPHDGWGIAYYQDRDVRLIKDTSPAGTSEWLRFVEGHCLRSETILSHIRHATQGDVRYANTQPFTRELGGRQHVLAHNGNLRGIREAMDLSGAVFHPVGETDSEWAFCDLMQRMVPLWTDPGRVPDLDLRMQTFAAFASATRRLGPANLLYSDGDTLFIHADRRKQPGGDIAAPGLWYLERECSPDQPGYPEIAGVSLSTGHQRVALAASVPLTDEAWRPLAHGEILAVRQGRILGTIDADGTGAS